MIDKVCGFATVRKGRRCGSLIAAAVAVSFALSPAPTAAAVAYDEGVSGDLSNNGLAPTLISLGVGSNTISGTSGRDQAGVVDRDYFTFTLGSNEALTAINVLQGTVPIGL